MRERQEPVRLQAEQEGEALARDEAADMAAALLAFLQEDQEAAPDDVALAAADSDDEHSEEEEEEKKVEPAAAEGWYIPVALHAPLVWLATSQLVRRCGCPLSARGCGCCSYSSRLSSWSRGHS